MNPLFLNWLRKKKPTDTSSGGAGLVQKKHEHNTGEEAPLELAEVDGKVANQDDVLDEIEKLLAETRQDLGCGCGGW